MNLAYLRILQRAWDRYTVDNGVTAALSVRVRGERVGEEVKVKHLIDFMTANKAYGTTIKAYEDEVGLNNGNMVTYTKWLMTGRLPSVQKGELIDFFIARWAANKVVKREIAQLCPEAVHV